MRSNVLKLAASEGVALLAACESLSSEQRTVVGVTAEATTGLITADVPKSDDDWRSIAALVRAAISKVIARNSTTQNCPCPKGDGTDYCAMSLKISAE